MLIQLRDLGALQELGRGGQGTVHRPTLDLAQRVHVGGHVVVKLYRKPLDRAASDELLRRVTWGRGLRPTERDRLLSCAAWPLALVADGPIASGIVMPDMSVKYGIVARTSNGATKPFLLNLEWLIEPEGFLQDRGQRIGFDTAKRVRYANRLADVVRTLHSHDIVIGDLSLKNVLGRPEGRYHAAVIDCDSMRFKGANALPTVETPGWTLPRDWSESASSKAADSYKFALAVLRLFARDQLTRNLGAHERHVPKQLRQPIAAGFDRDPARRPDADTWVAALAAIDPERAQRRYPGPTPGQQTTAVMKPVPQRPPGLVPTPPRSTALAPRPRRAVRVRGRHVFGAAGVATAVVLALSSADSGQVGDSQGGVKGQSATSAAGGLPRRVLRRHFVYLNQGRYALAFRLMAPQYRREHRAWPRLRAAASPRVKLIKLGPVHRRGAVARVSVRFFARDKVDTRRSDTRCRRFAGTAQLRRIHGLWRYDPMRNNLRSTVVSRTNARCP